MPSEAMTLATDRVATVRLRLCTGCGPRPLREFSPRPDSPDGLRCRCKRCERIAAYERYHERGGREKAAAYRARPEILTRDRAYRAQHGGDRNASQVTYRRTPRGKLVSSRGTALSRLRHATTDAQRARLETRIALYDREIARMDAEHELPAKLTRPRVRKCGESPCKGVYLTPAGTFEVRVSVGKSRSVRGGTFATLDEATAAANALAFRLRGIRDYAVPRTEEAQL